jgi:hypothetical protein
MAEDEDRPAPSDPRRAVRLRKLAYGACFWATLLAVHAAVQTEIHHGLRTVQPDLFDFASAESAADGDDRPQSRPATAPASVPPRLQDSTALEVLRTWFVFWRGAQAIAAPLAFLGAVALAAGRMPAGLRLRAAVLAALAGAAAFLMFFRECYLALMA